MKTKKIYLKGKPLNHNSGLRIWYEGELLALIKKMALGTMKSVKQFFNGETSEDFFKEQSEMIAMDDSIGSQARILVNMLSAKYKQMFSERALSLATRMVSKANTLSKSDLKLATKTISDQLSFKMDKLPENVREVSKAAIAENVSLIKSIPDKYFARITNAVTKSITSGEGFKYLTEHFSKYKGISDRQAKNLAINQTRSAYNAINAQRMKAANLKMFTWLHSGGGLHPRESHQEMNGKTYSLNKLPIVNKEQVRRGYEAPRRGLPGQEPGCGCTMMPIIEVG